MATQPLHGGGGQSILTSSSTATGDWYRVTPKLGKLTFQATHTGTSVGATVGSTTVIEVSNDGVNALDTVAGTISLSGDSPKSDGFTIDGHWEYVRAKINSVAATTAGSAGTGFAITVNVSAQVRS